MGDCSICSMFSGLSKSMKMGYVRVLLVVFLAYSKLVESESNSVEIVYPEKLYHDSNMQNDDGHYKDSLTLRIKSKHEGDLMINLKKDIPVQDKVLVRTYSKTGVPIHESLDHPGCMYRGSIEGKRESNAYISMCDGTIKGSLDTGTKRYQIAPHHDSGAHQFYNVDDEVNETVDRLSGDLADDWLMEDPDEQKDLRETHEQVKRWGERGNSKRSSLAPGEILSKLSNSPETSLTPMELINVEKKYLPYLTVNHTRYIEVFVSVGHMVSSHYDNDIPATFKVVMTAMGMVDQSYSAIGIRVVVAAMEIQNNGPTFERSSTFKTADALTTLESFRNHFNKIRKEGQLKDVNLDVGIFLSQPHWGGYTGLAYWRAMCTSSAASINRFRERILLRSTVTIGHELGHILGMLHTWEEPENCKCLEGRGCFMNSKVRGRAGFTNCGVRMMNERDFPCLSNHPKNTLISQCGNGIREGDEECDCGTEENCARNDPCCEPLGCRFKASSQCSTLDECCDNTCQFKQQGTMCREAATNCDVPEYCSGESATCPPDRVIADGTACGEKKKLILGTFRTKVTRRELSPWIEGRYFKIIPAHWSTSGICMRLELIGCPPQQEFSSTPTSMVTPVLRYTKGSRCLGPDVTSCKEVVDGTDLMYLKNIDGICKKPHMKFVHAADGTLRHHCTGKKVCARKGGILMISSQCTDEHSKFTRTQKRALKNVKTGKCIHAPARWGPAPYIKDKAVLKPKTWCTKASAEVILPYVECLVPLGLEDKTIPDTALSSAQTTDDTDITEVRMGQERTVCFDTKKTAGWVQIDVGKVTVLSAIDIAGSKYKFVTGFYLMYSDNGISWKYYKEIDNGNTEGLESVCYSGSCTPTLDHQCRTLWGADSTSASQQCYDELNTKADGYGTCSPTEDIPCQSSNVNCGQIQCASPSAKPFYVNYGSEYKKIMINGDRCSAAKISRESDEIGEGMVEEGTLCGDGKMCIDQVCKSVTPSCGKRGGKMCGGNGYCMDNGRCLCTGGYNPDDDCATELVALDGGWGNWSQWTLCPECESSSTEPAVRHRHRFCDNPTVKHGGAPCSGERKQGERCVCD